MVPELDIHPLRAALQFMNTLHLSYYYYYYYYYYGKRKVMSTLALIASLNGWRRVSASPCRESGLGSMSMLMDHADYIGHDDNWTDEPAVLRINDYQFETD